MDYTINFFLIVIFSSSFREHCFSNGYVEVRIIKTDYFLKHEPDE